MGRYRITGKDTAERLKEDRACSKALKYSILRKDSFMNKKITEEGNEGNYICLLYTSPSPRDVEESRMPSSA